MKTVFAYVRLVFMVVVLGVSTQATAFSEASLGDPFPAKTFRVMDVTGYCFTVPYSREEISTKFDSMMALDISRIAENSVPASLFNRVHINTRYYTDEDSPSSTVCYFHLTIMTISY